MSGNPRVPASPGGRSDAPTVIGAGCAQILLSGKGKSQLSSASRRASGGILNMCQRKWLTIVLLCILIAGSGGCTPQAVGPSAPSGGGTGAALRVSFTEAAQSADARTRAPTNPDRIEFDPGRLELPSVPTSGTRKQASTPGSATPQTSRILPCGIVVIFPCAFNGIAQDN